MVTSIESKRRKQCWLTLTLKVLVVESQMSLLWYFVITPAGRAGCSQLCSVTETLTPINSPGFSRCFQNLHCNINWSQPSYRAEKSCCFGKCLFYLLQGGSFTVCIRLLERYILRSAPVTYSKLIEFALSVCKGVFSSCSLLTHTCTYIFKCSSPK